MVVISHEKKKQVAKFTEQLQPLVKRLVNKQHKGSVDKVHELLICDFIFSGQTSFVFSSGHETRYFGTHNSPESIHDANFASPNNPDNPDNPDRGFYTIVIPYPLPNTRYLLPTPVYTQNYRTMLFWNALVYHNFRETTNLCFTQDHLKSVDHRDMLAAKPGAYRCPIPEVPAHVLEDHAAYYTGNTWAYGYDEYGEETPAMKRHMSEKSLCEVCWCTYTNRFIASLHRMMRYKDHIDEDGEFMRSYGGLWEVGMDVFNYRDTMHQPGCGGYQLKTLVVCEGCLTLFV